MLGNASRKLFVGLAVAATGASMSLAASMVSASALDTITTSCTDGTSHSMAAPALAGQTTADTHFNAHVGAVIGITCTTS